VRNWNDILDLGTSSGDDDEESSEDGEQGQVSGRNKEVLGASAFHANAFPMDISESGTSEDLGTGGRMDISALSDTMSPVVQNAPARNGAELEESQSSTGTESTDIAVAKNRDRELKQLEKLEKEQAEMAAKMQPRRSKIEELKSSRAQAEQRTPTKGKAANRSKERHPGENGGGAAAAEVSEESFSHRGVANRNGSSENGNFGIGRGKDRSVVWRGVGGPSELNLLCRRNADAVRNASVRQVQRQQERCARAARAAKKGTRGTGKRATASRRCAAPDATVRRTGRHQQRGR
jgi:hypothetical protein